MKKIYLINFIDTISNVKPYTVEFPNIKTINTWYVECINTIGNLTPIKFYNSYNKFNGNDEIIINFSVRENYNTIKALKLFYSELYKNIYDNNEYKMNAYSYDETNHKTLKETIVVDNFNTKIKYVETMEYHDEIELLLIPKIKLSKYI